MTAARDGIAPVLAELATVTEALDKQEPAFDSTTVEEATELLAELQASVTTLRQLETVFERWIAECFRAEGWRANEARQVGGLAVEVRRSKNRRAWDHEQLRKDYLNAYLEANGGEAPDPFTVVQDFLKVASVGSWKVTGLRAFGIDPDDYCDSSPAAPHVAISRPQPGDEEVTS